MIKGFDQETQPLNDYETGVLLPLLVRGLRTKIGREDAIRAVRLSIARQRRILYEQKREEKQGTLFNK